MSGGSEPLSLEKDHRGWRVLHLGDDPYAMFGLAQAAQANGMYALGATPNGIVDGATPLQGTPKVAWHSVWNEVRRWRPVLSAASSCGPWDVYHAHSFAAGMAAVRHFGCVIYELHEPIEDILIDASPSLPLVEYGESADWLRRSFHVAEEFVLSRAKAVVTISTRMRDRLAERVRAEKVFVVPDGYGVAHSAHPYPTDLYGAAYGYACHQSTAMSRASRTFIPPQYSL